MKQFNWITSALGLVVLGLTPACGKSDDSPPKPAVYLTGEAAAKWDNLCVSCHGKTGIGDGVAAAALKVKPRSFSDQEWQKSVTDEHLAKVIVEGGKAAGKSELMPANPDLVGKPEVVKQLISKIRSY